jgi:hypothetical protein
MVSVLLVFFPWKLVWSLQMFYVCLALINAVINRFGEWNSLIKLRFLYITYCCIYLASLSCLSLSLLLFSLCFSTFVVFLSCLCLFLLLFSLYFSTFVLFLSCLSLFLLLFYLCFYTFVLFSLYVFLYVCTSIILFFIRLLLLLYLLSKPTLFWTSCSI